MTWLRISESVFAHQIRTKILNAEKKLNKKLYSITVVALYGAKIQPKNMNYDRIRWLHFCSKSTAH